MPGKFGRTVGKLNVKVLPDASDFYDDLQKKLQEIEKKLKDIVVNVDADTTMASLHIDEFLEEWEEKAIDFRLDVEDAKAKLQLERAQRNRVVQFFVKVNDASLAKSMGILGTLSGGNVAAQFFSDITDSITHLDESVGKISRVATSIANLSSVLLSAASSAVTVGADILAIGNLALVGPAVFGALATGAVTLIVALKVMRDELESLGPAFTKIKGIVQTNFWAAAREPILEMVNSLLPSLEKGMGSISTSLGKQIATMAQTLQKSLGGGVLTRLLKAISDSMDIVTSGMAPLTRAFVTLGLVGSMYLPRLAQAFVNVTTKFNDWVQANTANGHIFDYIEAGIRSLQNLFKAAGGIIGIFSAINKAATAAGNGGLATFANSLAGASAIMNSPAVQGAMTTVLEGVGTAMSALSGGVKAIGSALVDLAPTIKTVLAASGEALGGLLSTIGDALKRPEFKEGLLNLFNGISKGIKGLEPAIGPVADLLGHLGTTLGILASNFGPLFGTIKTTFAPLLESILSVVDKMIPVLSGGLTEAFKSLGPVITKVSGFIKENSDVIAKIGVPVVIAVAALSGLIKGFLAVKQAVGFIQGVVVAVKELGVVTKIATAIQWLYNIALEANPIGLIIAAISLLVVGLIYFFTQTKLGKEIFANVVSFIKDAIINIGNFFAGLGSTVSDNWKNAFGLLVSITTTVFNAVKDFITGAVNGIVNVFKVVIDWVVANWPLLLAILTGPIGLAVLFITSNWQLILDTTTAIFTAIGTAISTAFTAILDFFIALGTNIAANWTAAWNLLASIVTTVFTAVTGAIQVAFDAVIGFFVAVGANIAATWTASWNLLVSIVTTVFAAVTGAISGAFAAVVGFFVSVGASMAATWTAGWNLIRSVVSSALSVVSGAISSGFSAVVGFFSNVISNVTGTWSRGWSVVSSTVSSVVSAVGGFVGSLVGTVTNKVSEVMSVFTGIQSQVTSVFSGAGKWLVDSGKALVQGFIDGITGFIDKAKNAASSLVTSISNFFPHSPAKEGPFSGKGWTLYSGQALAEGFSDGMDSRLATVRKSALALAAAATPDVPSLDVSETATGLEAAAAKASANLQLLALGTNVTVEGNVGYDPNQIAKEMDMKKRQAQMSVNLSGLVTA